VFSELGKKLEDTKGVIRSRTSKNDRKYNGQNKKRSINTNSATKNRDELECSGRVISSKLKSSLRKFYGRHHDLVNRNGIYASQITRDMEHNRNHNPVTIYHDKLDD
jgi:hypothetical protein